MFWFSDSLGMLKALWIRN